MKGLTFKTKEERLEWLTKCAAKINELTLKRIEQIKKEDFGGAYQSLVAKNMAKKLFSQVEAPLRRAAKKSPLKY